MKKYLPQLILLIALLCISAAASAAPVHVKAVIQDTYGFNGDAEVDAYTDKYQLWLPITSVKSHIHDSIFIDHRENKAFITFSLPSFRLETEQLDRMISNGVELNFPLKEINGQLYINMYGLEKLFGIATVLHDDNKTVSISDDPHTGFLHPAKLNKVRKKEAHQGKLNLVWDHVFDQSRDLAKEQKITGLDIISPTWFAVVSEDGQVISKADMKYVQDAHDKGYKVWALVSNSFDRELTKKILASETAKQNIIKQLVVYASVYNLDGINIDFENVYDEDKDKLTQFIGALTAALKEQNLVVSIDVTVPSSSPFWSACYDRKALGKIVDYMMVMTYDEHWRTSPVAGSVASIGWVEKGIAAMLTYVPKEKLLMGIPFYTREWEETTVPDGIKVKSKALSMAQADKIVQSYKSDVVWLEDKGQHYTEYSKDDKRYRIWLEDDKSISLKANLVHKYQLAGAASWRKDFEKPYIWDILNQILKKK